MRYRGGGKIGAFDDNKPQKTAAVGCWKLGEACQWLSVDRWPRRLIYITQMPEYVDTTVGGFGEIKPNISTDYGYGVIQWQYSDNGGDTWTNIPSDTKHAVDQYYGWLTLSDQKRNVDVNGNTVNGGMPVDGRLYRVVVTCGLRSKSSDYYSDTELKWYGRCEVWNDKVNITWSTQPPTTATGTVGYDITITATAVGVGEEHGLNYDVKYRWQTSTNNGSTWALLPENTDAGGDGSTLTFNPPFSGNVLIRARATFSYSDPPDHVITGRPDVVSYSDPVLLTVT